MGARGLQRGFALVATVLVALGLSACDPTAASFTDTVVLDGLTAPTSFDFADDGRLFVAEQRGIVKVFDNALDTTATVFADLRTQVHNFRDRGLLGLRLDPDFPARPYVYVLYAADALVGQEPPLYGTPGADTDPCRPAASGGCPASVRVSRLQAQADAMSGETVLLHDACHQFGVHDGGGLAFGADGSLFASLGEGADTSVDYGQRNVPNPCGDPPVPAGSTPTPPTAEGGALRAQDLRTPADPVGLSGTVVRIDPDTGAPWPGNPLQASADPNARKVVGSGLRNPFRLATRPGTSEVWVADVGWERFEEIDRLPAGASTVPNFGWPCYEGDGRQPLYDAVDLDLCEDLYAESGAVAGPYLAYPHDERMGSGDTCSSTLSGSITGLTFYEDGSYPDRYDGGLFFTDVLRGCIFFLPVGEGGLPDPDGLETLIGTGGWGNVDLRPGPGGDLFYLNVFDGTLHRIHHGTNSTPMAAIAADPASGEAPLTVQLDGSGSSDTDPGDSLSYAWDLDDDGAFDDASGAQATATLMVDGAHVFRLRVTDSQGAVDTASTAVTVGGTPVPVIDSPTASDRWSSGAPVSFTGHATGPDGRTLDPSALRWSVILHHCSTPTDCHQHHQEDFVGVASGEVEAPDHAWPARLELSLTATSASGVSAATSVTVDPRTAQLSLRSNPSGLPLLGATRLAPTPYETTAIVGSNVTLGAPANASLDGVTYAFEGWSDGGAAVHDVVVPATDPTYLATFRSLGRPPVADAGPDQAVGSGAGFGLDATRSKDPEEGPLTYRWEQTGGPAVVLDDDRRASPTVTGVPGPATLTFQVGVTDTSGQTAHDTVVVTVSAPK